MSIGIWTRASPRRKRLLSIIAVLIVVVIITGLGTLVPVTKEDANQIYQQVNQTDNVLNEQGAFALTSLIFGNNLLICLLMFVPLIGPLLGLVILFGTGTNIAGLALATNIPTGLYLFVLLITPHTWLEFVAYAVAMSASVWLFMRIIQGRGWQELKKNTTKFIVVSVLFLVAAAFVEVGLIYALGG